MNTYEQQATPRLIELEQPWSRQFWKYLHDDIDIYAWMPNSEGCSFSMWQAQHVVPETAMRLLDRTGLRLSVYRNFLLPPSTRHATMLHRDCPSSPCFAVNVCIQGSLKVHFYRDLTTPDPVETYELAEGALFIMDTSAIHQADTSNCDKQVVLASFIPNPQYRYEDAIEFLNASHQR